MDIIGVSLEICALGFFGGFIAFFIFEIRPRHIKEFFEAPAEKLPVIPLIEKSKVKSTYFGTTGLIFVVSLLIVGTEAITFYDQINTYDWKEENGTVDYTEKREASSTTCGEDGCSTSYWDYPYIRYSYEANGEIYSNDDIVLFELDEGKWGFSDGITDDYPVGSEISVFYNPKNPDEAVLMKGFSGVIPPIIMVSQIIIGVYIAVTAFLVLWKISFHFQPSSNRKKATASSLDIFDVKKWDSKSDGQQIVDWYNEKMDEKKTVEDFMGMCGISEFDSKNDAKGIMRHAEKIMKIKDRKTSIPLQDKPVIKMTDAGVFDGRLSGHVSDHPKLGTQNIVTSRIIEMTFDKEGVCTIETRNSAYLVETDDWSSGVPANHPSLMPDEDWWD